MACYGLPRPHVAPRPDDLVDEEELRCDDGGGVEDLPLDDGVVVDAGDHGVDGLAGEGVEAHRFLTRGSRARRGP